jgi:C1A family cysteine protease
MTPVKDQGSCGSCWAFGPVGAVEAIYNIEHGTHKNIDLAEQELVSPCFGNGNAGDCWWGFAKRSLEYMNTEGLVAESKFPYQSFNALKSVPDKNDPNQTHDECTVQGSHCSIPPTCQDSSLGTQRWGVSSVRPVDANAKDVKKALLCHGPLLMDSVSWGHFAVLVGWNDTAQQWTVKNSWGTSPSWNGYNQIDYTGDPHGDLVNTTYWVQWVTGP